MHSFSVKKPGNIREVLSQVSMRIQDKGGTFSGDEKSGNFGVIGIEGSYAIEDEITIHITKKPFVFPMSAIEQQIKEYFCRALLFS